MQLHPSGPTPAGKGGAEDAAAPSGFHSRLEGHRVQTQTSVPPACGGDMGARKRGTRSRRSRDSPMPTPCIQALCFDPLVRRCLECNLLRTPDPPRHGKTAHGDRRDLPQGPQPGSATCPSADPEASGPSWPSPTVSLSVPPLPSLRPLGPPPSVRIPFTISARDSAAAAGVGGHGTRAGRNAAAARAALRRPCASGTGAGAGPCGPGDLEVVAAAQNGLP